MTVIELINELLHLPPDYIIETDDGWGRIFEPDEVVVNHSSKTVCLED
jgi:hypothetical protein